MSHAVRIPHPDDARFGASRGDDLGPATSDKPLLKQPHWGATVTTYLFLGGIMGGLGILQALCNPRDESMRKLRRSTRIASFVLASVNPLILISHLGRPERFLHMMRIAKLKSPMSVGVWGLVLYSGVAGANVIREFSESGFLPRWMKYTIPQPLTQVQAFLGAFIAGYTGVLLSATAIPLWGAGKRHVPAASLASGVAGACALASLISLIEGNHAISKKTERLEILASALEFVILKDFERISGVYGQPMFQGARGKRLQDMTFVAGIAAPTALNLLGQVIRLPQPVDSLRILLSSTLTLIGGYILRQTLIESGKASASIRQTAIVQPT